MGTRYPRDTGVIRAPVIPSRGHGGLRESGDLLDPPHRQGSIDPFVIVPPTLVVPGLPSGQKPGIRRGLGDRVTPPGGSVLLATHSSWGYTFRKGFDCRCDLGQVPCASPPQFPTGYPGQLGVVWLSLAGGSGRKAGCGVGAARLLHCPNPSGASPERRARDLRSRGGLAQGPPRAGAESRDPPGPSCGRGGPAPAPPPRPRRPGSVACAVPQVAAMAQS